MIRLRHRKVSLIVNRDPCSDSVVIEIVIFIDAVNVGSDVLIFYTSAGSFRVARIDSVAGKVLLDSELKTLDASVAGDR